MESFASAKRVVVKVGTSTLTYETGHINIRRLEKLVEVLCDLQNSGRQMVLVTSGAISVGQAKLGLRERPDTTKVRQAVAAVGQLELMRHYDTVFARQNHVIAQVLLTRDVVEEPVRRQNVINTFDELFILGVIPVINENDTVAVDELEGENFGDNDTLSAVVATLVDADALVLMTDIDGLYTANPQTDPDARLIPLVESLDENILAIAGDTKSNRGTGGMLTKIHAAQVAVPAGIDMAIISGQDPALLYDLLDGLQVGTRIVAGK